MSEEWRAIPGYEGFYEVSNIGNVRSLDRNVMCNDGTFRFAKGKKKILHFTRHGYPAYKLNKDLKRKSFNVHRLIAMAFLDDYSKELEVDHINNDRSDNRVENLRMCTRAENMRNRSSQKSKSIYKGVTIRNKRWIAQIAKDSKQQLIGYYNSELEAAVAYDKEAIRLHGEFAKTNKMLGLVNERE